jgi:hypothetical protein
MFYSTFLLLFDVFWFTNLLLVDVSLFYNNECKDIKNLFPPPVKKREKWFV